MSLRFSEVSFPVPDRQVGTQWTKVVGEAGKVGLEGMSKVRRVFKVLRGSRVVGRVIWRCSTDDDEEGMESVLLALGVVVVET